MKKIKLVQIGVVHSPLKEPRGAPIQSIAGKEIEGTVEVFKDYCKGLEDLEGFSHIMLLYHFHRSKGFSLTVTPYMDNRKRGVFSTRAPHRPNPIGLSIVQLVKIEGNILHIKNLDMIDGTPLLDIKPYIPEFDVREPGNIGWLKNNISKLSTSKDNGRFAK